MTFTLQQRADLQKKALLEGAPAAATSGPRSPLAGMSYDEASAALAPVQARGDVDPQQVHQHAAVGVAGAGGTLPHLEAIQRSFGHHDVSGTQAHVGGKAAQAASAMGAEAYATGNSVAFANQPDLHTAAHEAAHVVQQRAGVQLAGGVGQVGDSYERHADAVADAVVAGKPAQGLLDQMTGGASGALASATQAKALQLKAKRPTKTTKAGRAALQTIKNIYFPQIEGAIDQISNTKLSVSKRREWVPAFGLRRSQLANDDALPAMHGQVSYKDFMDFVKLYNAQWKRFEEAYDDLKLAAGAKGSGEYEELLLERWKTDEYEKVTDKAMHALRASITSKQDIRDERAEKRALRNYRH